MSKRVVVLGAGIIGAACARSLAMAGNDVVIIDRASAASGTTAHGEGNILVSDKAPGAELAMALRAAAAWPALAAELRDELGEGFPPLEFEPKGGIVVATTDAAAQTLLAFAATQRGAGVDARVLSASEARSREPDLTERVVAAVHYPQDSQVQPVIAAQALLASARRHGATVMQHTEVTAPIVNGDGALVGVRTDHGEISADAVVIASGPWSGSVAETLGVPIPVLPRHGWVLVTSRMKRRVFHKVYDADYVGAVGSGDAGLQTSSVVESTASGNVLIGSSRQQLGFDDRMRPDTLEAIAAKAIRLFPFLADHTIIRAYGGFRPYMPDHLPVVGPDHRFPGLWHATGHEGAGIGLAPVTGDLLAAMIGGTETAIDPAPYSPSRATLAPHLAAAS